MVTVLLLYQSVGCLVFAVVTQWLSAQSLTANRISRRNRGKEKKGERPAKAGHFSLLFDPCSLSLSQLSALVAQYYYYQTTSPLSRAPLSPLLTSLSFSKRTTFLSRLNWAHLWQSSSVLAEVHKHTLTVSSFNLILMPITPSPAICNLRSGSDFAV